MRRTKKAAALFVHSLKEEKRGKRKSALVVGLFGNLGAGKTTFTQEVARLLGIREKIISPTFVIMRIYPITGAGVSFKRLIHIDAYRLAGPRDLPSLGFKEILKDKRNLIMIEWADRVSKVLPKDHRKIIFEFAGADDRKIYYG
jgi:tRNA threonylcarbamoyladenosine biosynthesis protein TsaE